MTAQEKETLIHILSNFETRSSKDIKTLMEIYFNAGKSGKYKDLFEFQFEIKQLLEL